MKKIIITVENEENLAEVCHEVAELIMHGYYGGLVGWSCDSWCIEDV